MKNRPYSCPPMTHEGVVVTVVVAEELGRLGPYGFEGLMGTDRLRVRSVAGLKTRGQGGVAVGSVHRVLSEQSRRTLSSTVPGQYLGKINTQVAVLSELF